MPSLAGRSTGSNTYARFRSANCNCTRPATGSTATASGLCSSAGCRSGVTRSHWWAAYAGALAQLCGAGSHRQGLALRLCDLGGTGSVRFSRILTVKVTAQQWFTIKLGVHHRHKGVHTNQLPVQEHELLGRYPEVTADGRAGCLPGHPGWQVALFPAVLAVAVHRIVRPLALVPGQGLQHRHANLSELFQHFPGPVVAHEAQLHPALDHLLQVVFIGRPDHLDDRVQKLPGIALYRTEIEQHNAIIIRLLPGLTGNTDPVIAEVGIGLDFAPDKQLPEKQLKGRLAQGAPALQGQLPHFLGAYGMAVFIG